TITSGDIDPPAPGDIHLSLAAIMSGLPPEMRQNVTIPVPEDVRVKLPLELVEPQLASGKVDMEMSQFIAVLPNDFKSFFALNDQRRVPLPLTEIFQNLPDQKTVERSKTVREQMLALQMDKASREAAARANDDLSRKLIE